MDTAYSRPQSADLNPVNVRIFFPALLTLIAAGIMLFIGFSYYTLAHDAPLLTDSTLGELAVWMVEQSTLPAPPSLLANWAKNWSGGEQANLDAVIDLMQTLFLGWCAVSALLLLTGIVGLFTHANWTRAVLIGGLIGFDALLLFIPPDTLQALILLGIVLMLAVLLVSPGRVNNFIGFMVAVSSLLVIWETAKPIAESVNYKIVVGAPGWVYTTYPSLEEALNALQAGDIAAVITDENDLEDLMADYPERTAPADFTYPDLRYLRRLIKQDSAGFLPVNPEMPGRLSAAVRADQAAGMTRISQLVGMNIGAVEGDFAVDRLLSVPRELVLLDISFLNDLNLPHLQSIAEAFMQPARRNGDFLLARILSDAGLFTLREAVFGFAFGVVFGLLLGTFFAHSRLMERALLPYVVASQTVPILALAPMVVIWLGANFLAVAVIAAYITFFPVAINTLRGLQSPNPIQVELMQSYAATRLEILWKLRFPAALPYIFAALKVSATASVVGAIIGELPSGISDGLGRAILNFSSDYSLVSTPKLWAAIIMAASVGILFFVSISLLERVVLRRYVRSA